MERYSDEAIRIIDELHTERLDYQSEYIPLIDAAQRLDAYESTGMEPENIGALHDELNQYKELGDLDRLREAVTRQKEYEQFMERWKEAVKIAGAVKDIGGARIAELVQADREGRCVVLPCKVGDKVWFIKFMWSYATQPIPATVHGIKTFSTDGTFVFMTSTDKSKTSRSFTNQDVGKTVFLTREAAEKALEEMEGE